MNVEVARVTATTQNQTSRLSHTSWTMLVGVAALVVYLLLLPFVERTWRATGDEPHYLLAAHSLVTDGDFDLTNNYAQLDYLAFYLSQKITPQIRTNAAGRQILDHNLGLPVLIAPAYALGGRFGVLLFQAILGALLAMLSFKLAFWISQDEIASLLATLAVAFTPLLLLYQYLVYPELFGALLTTLPLYYAISRDKATPGAALVVILALATLPWLNRRFIPLAAALALLLVWAWRPSPPLPSSQIRRGGWGVRELLSNAGTLGFGITALSIAALLWFNSQFKAPARVDFTMPDGTLIWLRLARGIGWLVDQQRGLFIYAPIYIVALWGLPFLLSDSLRQRNRHWFVLVPFALALGVTAVAGGFWVAWELGPRFLVVALPALVPLLALAWRQCHRSRLWVGLAALLLALSLYHSLVIICNPELPYKSSLALYYEKQFNLPLTEILPDLAGYTTLSAAQADPNTNQIVSHDDATVWFAPAGRASDLLQPVTLPELPAGHYRLSWPLRVESGLPSKTELLRLSVKLLGGGQLFNQVLTADELPADGRFGHIQYVFLNTNVDRWRTPLVFQAVSSGQSNIWAGDVSFRPDPFYAWFLPYLYLVILAGSAGLLWYRFRRPGELKNYSPHPVSGLAQDPPLPRLGERLEVRVIFKRPFLPWWVTWSALLILLLLTFGYLIYQQSRSSRRYDAQSLFHFVGQPIADAQAEDGQAWLVDPQVDPPQKAIYGPFDIYGPGTYHVTFRLKLPEPVETGQLLARLQVSATDNFETLVSQPLHSEHFSRPGRYHHFVLTVDTPRRQALSFDVNYTGLAPLVIDGVTIERVEIGE